MTPFWGQLVLLVLYLTTSSHGQFLGMMDEQKPNPVVKPQPPTAAPFNLENFLMNILKGLSSLSDSPQGDSEEDHHKYKGKVNRLLTEADEDENEIIPAVEEKQEQPKEEENKNVGKVPSPSIIKPFKDPSGQLGLELDFDMDMPQPKGQTKFIKMDDTPKEIKQITPVVNKDEHKMSLLDLLFPPVPRLTFPKKEETKGKCSDVTCPPPPAGSSCEKADVKKTPKFNDLGDCCPLWLCTGPDGSFHTHYGMNKVGAQSSVFQSSSSSSSNQNFGIIRSPQLNFPKMNFLKPFGARAQEKKQFPEPILLEFHDESDSPSTGMKKVSGPSQSINPLDEMMMSMFGFPPPSHGDDSSKTEIKPMIIRSGPMMFSPFKSMKRLGSPQFIPFPFQGHGRPTLLNLPISFF